MPVASNVKTDTQGYMGQVTGEWMQHEGYPCKTNGCDKSTKNIIEPEMDPGAIFNGFKI